MAGQSSVNARRPPTCTKGHSKADTFQVKLSSLSILKFWLFPKGTGQNRKDPQGPKRLKRAKEEKPNLKRKPNQESRSLKIKFKSYQLANKALI